MGRPFLKYFKCKHFRSKTLTCLDVFKKVESSFNGILSILYSMFKRCLKAGSYYNTNLLRPTMDLGISVGVGRWEIFYLCDTAVHCKFPVTSNWSERAFRVDESCHGAL